MDRFAGPVAAFWTPDGALLALERRFGRPGRAKLPLERSFGRPGSAKLALDRRFGRPAVGIAKNGKARIGSSGSKYCIDRYIY